MCWYLKQRMELAIIAGVGLVGFFMSTAGTQARPGVDPDRPKQPRPTDGYPDAYAGGTKARREIRAYEAEARKRWNQSLNPQLTGIVNPNTVRDAGQMPFFRSMKSQNTNDSVKQRRMELYTGAVDMNSSATGTYRRKQEIPLSHPTNAQPVTSSGSQGNPSEVRDLDRYIVPQQHNNVSPLPQVRVGPGLGLGPDAPSTDGFHPMLRVLPSNLDVEMKKNELGAAATNHGFNKIAAGTNRMEVAKNRPDVPMTGVCDRPLTKSRAASTAQAYRITEDGRAGVGKIVGGEYYGAAGAPAPAGMETSVTEGRFKSDDTEGNKPVLNLTGAAYGVGAFVGEHHDGARFSSQQRESSGGFGFMQAQQQARTAPAGQIMPATNRDLTRRDMMLHGTVTPTMPIGEMRHFVAPKTTLRQQTVGQAPFSNMKAGSGGAMDNVFRHASLDRESKRGSQTVERVNAPMRVNIRTYESAGRARFKSDRTPRCQPALPTVTTGKKYGEVGKLTTNFNKLDDVHPHTSALGTIRPRSNPFTIPSFAA